ncbi:MAG: hypothetical protein IJE70_01890 [Oscillospiraceae bacterium]|nr:hypothetical protein [Oscillospiraceae bacterium]MBQ2840073.1 hypothetical protein [Oscillospiraceae bacterium]MBQ6902081.1 hypothetical protein [Oscillospiraceae bacterium]
MPEKKETKILTYKGRALTRKDKVLYYGSMADKYIIMLQITDSKELSDIELATRVSLSLQLTDPSIKSKDRIVKKTETEGLYQAMDIAAIWLERALAAENK